ncbi:MAG TPA: Cof-type HAD-IIB family hydrolase [Flavobacteriaceae bacterium]|jgi:Cof subfamily protein (haloacid dehalogenase superfamily)|nr:Cof-type HAD-IIB family hydrolase [Flavobacteriaceae bacterium]HBS13216.1 Cof-type HAD-IIB family hydrolase [Flavobacteriaceae bacterium]
MDLSKVKLVVTDMDGTLLNSKHEVSSKFFSLFSELKNHIHFVAASGRQYHSIIHKLETIKDDITVIAENGGFAMQGNQEFMVTSLSNEKIQQLIPLIRKLNYGYAVLCGKNSAYIETRDEYFISLFDEYYIKYKIVDDLTKVTNDEFLKIAVYHFESSEEYLYPTFSYLKDKDLLIKVSEQNWLDISHPDANKGHALKHLQEKLGISKEETVVFGDYNNDLEMLKLAHFSYAMKNAIPKVKEVANYETKSNDEQGVEFILEKLLKAKKSL